jgi:hypothetical protein
MKGNGTVIAESAETCRSAVSVAAPYPFFWPFAWPEHAGRKLKDTVVESRGV